MVILNILFFPVLKTFLCKKYDNSLDATTDNCTKLFFSLPYLRKKQSQKNRTNRVINFLLFGFQV